MEQQIYLSIHNKLFAFILSKYEVQEETPEYFHIIKHALKRSRLIEKYKLYNIHNIDYLFLLERLYLFQISPISFHTPLRQWTVLRNFINRWKLKRMRLYPVDTDLNLKPLPMSLSETIGLIEQGYIYRFTLSDLTKIIDTSLQYHEYLFPTPKMPKNPYTNIPFSRHNLYNIIIACKLGGKRISALFQQFMNSDFNIDVFYAHNDRLLRETTIHQYFIENRENVNAFSTDDIHNIIVWYCKTIHVPVTTYRIHPECPTNVFIPIFIPYLKLYYQYSYLNSINAKNKLLVCLNQFYIYNPNFGKAYMIPNQTQQNIRYGFDLRYLPLTMMEFTHDISHLYPQIQNQTYESADDFLTLPPIFIDVIYLSYYSTIQTSIGHVSNENTTISNIHYLYSSSSDSDSESNCESDNDEY